VPSLAPNRSGIHQSRAGGRHDEGRGAGGRAHPKNLRRRIRPVSQARRPGSRRGPAQL